MYFREKTSTNGTLLLQLVHGSRGLDGKVRRQLLLFLGGCVIPDVLRREIAHNVEAIAVASANETRGGVLVEPDH